MRFSVVTISFNQADFLRAAIESVLSQSNVEIEYIVVDPGSKDGSREIIANYGSRIAHTVFEADDGPADGLNKGFSRATGDVFCFLNSDDEFLPGAFATMAREFQTRPNLDFLSGCGYFVDQTGARGKRIVPTRLSVTDYLYGSCTLFQQGTFFRRKCWELVGGFNQANRTCWDGELFLQMAKFGQRHDVIYSNVALFRLHAGSISGSGRLIDTYEKDLARIFQEAMGRSRRPTDDLLAGYLRTTKLLRHPRYALERLRRASHG